MKLFKISALYFSILILLLSQIAPSNATVQDLKALNDEVKELASKIKQGYAARDNAIAAGEAKLT